MALAKHKAFLLFKMTLFSYIIKDQSFGFKMFNPQTAYGPSRGQNMTRGVGYRTKSIVFVIQYFTHLETSYCNK